MLKYRTKGFSLSNVALAALRAAKENEDIMHVD